MHTLADWKNSFTGIPLTFIAMLLMSTFPEWHGTEDEDDSRQDVKYFPSGAVSRLCLGIIILSSIFLFVSAFWQHISSSAGATMAQSLSYGTVKAHVGPKASMEKPFLVQFALGVLLRLP